MAFTRRFRISPMAGFLAAAVIAAAAFGSMTDARAMSTYPIGVTVDGTQISFPRTQPVEMNGSVLVPLRGVFEALGAGVDYNPDTQTVTAIGGGRTVVVAIGSTTATINGQPQPLSVPAQIINGSTMVPLRFVAEALGDYVDWAPDTHMVSITRQVPSPYVASIPPMMPRSMDGIGERRLVGVVRQVMPDTFPQQIVVSVDGRDRDIALSSNATILRARIGHDEQAVSLADIEPGDRVVISRNDDGSAFRIASSFGLVFGTVDYIDTRADGSHIVNLTDGQRVELARSARVLSDGAPIAVADLVPGDQVTIATDPDDNIAYRVNVNAPINAHRR